MEIGSKKIEIEFTDEQITSSAGSVFLSQAASRLGLGKFLQSALKLKCRHHSQSEQAVKGDLCPARPKSASFLIPPSTKQL